MKTSQQKNDAHSGDSLTNKTDFSKKGSVAGVQATQLQRLADDSAIVQKAKVLQAMADARYRKLSFDKSVLPPSGTGIIQGKVIQLRPGWINPASRMIERTKELFPNEGFDLAHRLSYENIEYLYGQDKNWVLKNVTIPQRQFGAIAQGDKRYYNWVKQSSDDKEALQRLNSSPYNLRPGNASTNRSLGKKFDPNAQDDGTLTPQSEELIAGAKDKEHNLRSSTFYGDGDFNIWEKYVYTSDLPDDHS
ncbi:hypothetical protein MUY27_15255 [Mucilaginibacter sp. RS28]|uniref:Uncharacterized protein n=1 Tax=Mucilaginibacter straminoryzae TaxID=2932774 RepID=A0A9X1X6L4_9SPHI|nr:hypothetical protein [Mucilaginibacter straminoryzae]MCJ8211075.1 hypothetical protein [Mucilaginibacter straminoryzae]